MPNLSSLQPKFMMSQVATNAAIKVKTFFFGLQLTMWTPIPVIIDVNKMKTRSTSVSRDSLANIKEDKSDSFIWKKKVKIHCTSANEHSLHGFKIFCLKNYIFTSLHQQTSLRG